MRRRVCKGLQVGIGLHEFVGSLLHLELELGVGPRQGRAGLAQRLLVSHALGDVPQDHREELLTLQINLRDGRLNRELLAVGTQTIHRPQGAYRPRADAREPEARDLLRMLGPKSLGEEPVQRLAQRLLAPHSKHLLRRRVEQHDALRAISGNHGVHGRANDPIETGVAVPERLLGLLAEKLLFGFPQGPAHGGAEPPNPLLEHIIRRPHLQRLNGHIFTQRPREEHKGHLRAHLSCQPQRLEGIHSRHRIVRENQPVSARLKMLLEGRHRVHSVALDLQSFGAKQVQHHFGVHGVVFQM